MYSKCRASLLVLVVLNLHKLRVYGLRVQTQSNKSIDRGRFGDDLERPRLLILELDDLVVTADDLVAFVLGVYSIHVLSA